LLDLLDHLTKTEEEDFLQGHDFDTLENHAARLKECGFQFEEKK
jgi:hypothetical protein